MVYRQILVWMIFILCWGGLLAGQRVRSSEGSEFAEIGMNEDQADSKEDQNSDLSSYVLVEEENIRLVPSRQSVATKTPMPLLLTPFSVGVVTEGLFASQQAQVLSDALQNVSGVATHTGFGVFDYFVIRGFDSLSSGLVLVDGAPEPESTFYHLYNVESVEVLKGPGAFLYGGNPLAGSVNLVRKEAVFENFCQTGGRFGSFGTARGQLDFNQKNAGGNFAFRLNTFGRRSNAYRVFKDNWQVGINPSASFQLGQKSLLSLNFEYVRNDYKPDSGIPLYRNQIPDVPRTQSYQSPFDVSDQNIYRIRMDFTTTVSHSLMLRNKFYYTDLAWRSDGTIFPAVLPNEEGRVDVYRSLLRLDDRQRLVGNQTEALLNFTTGRIKHDLLFGFELRRIGDAFSLDVAHLPPLDLFDPVETASRPGVTIPSLSQIADTRTWDLAPYFLEQISLFDPVTVFVGGRFDALDFEDSVSGLVRDSHKFSPLIGITYAPARGLTVYANAGQAFAPPSSQVVGERAPEESSQFELGLKKEFCDGKALLTLAFYHLERDNIAIPDQTGVTRQIGGQRSRGVEFDLVGELDSTLYVFGSYAFTDARLTEFRELIDPSFGQFPPILVDRSGNWPAFVPKHIFNLWLIKEFSRGFSLGAGPRYVSRQFIAADNDYAIDPALTFNLSLAYRLEDWKLSLNVRNLTGTEYETMGYGSNAVLPADSFAVYVGVDFAIPPS